MYLVPGAAAFCARAGYKARDVRGCPPGSRPAVAATQSARRPPRAGTGQALVGGRVRERGPDWAAKSHGGAGGGRPGRCLRSGLKLAVPAAPGIVARARSRSFPRPRPPATLESGSVARVAATGWTEKHTLLIPAPPRPRDPGPGSRNPRPLRALATPSFHIHRTPPPVRPVFSPPKSGESRLPSC